MKLGRRTFTASGLALAASAGGARAQEYPDRLIKIVVPISTGSTTDILARLLADQLRQALGQPVIVENRPGAGGTIGSSIVAKAPPDGYTLMIVSSAHTSNPALYASLPYDSLTDFKGITMLTTMPNILVVAPSKGIKTVAELVARAKAKPGEMTYGSGGVGSAAHMNAEQFRAMAGIDALHVPYKGTPEMMADLVAGRIDFAFISVVGVAGAIKEGKLTALASGTDKRSKLLPDVPTTVEGGVPGSSYNVWVGLFAPGGTPNVIVDKLNRTTVAILQSPEIVEKFAALGADAAAMTPAAFDTYVAKEITTIKELVKTAKIPTN
ncbi:tripartite tricarboxylate transporter substrate binding protein [soil metagenome]